MKAAVVRSFDTPPRYTDFDLAEPTDPDEVVLDVLAAGLHPRVRSQADGSHYTSTDELPLVPGIDGVGRDADGRLHYFVLGDTALGSMAEQTVVDRRRCVKLPDDIDPIVLAAAMNPAMSSWIALRQRIDFSPGQSVLVLGATGNAGQLAVQVARHLGAGQIIAAARDSQRLPALAALGATETVALDSPALGPATADIDVVLDYLWGEPTATAMVDVVSHRSDRGRPLNWIEIGSVAGPAAAIPSAALRAARMQILGSGQGSVSTRQIVAELAELATTVGRFAINARARGLSEVSEAWAERSADRVVLVP